MIIPNSDWSEFRRQPLAAVWQILFKATVSLLKAFWPFILIIWIRSDENRGFFGVDFFLIVFSSIAVLRALAEYFFYTFRINNEDVQVRHGIFSRKQVILPLSKIQTVQTNQNWIQKIFGLSELAFDTPGSDKAEVTFQLHQSEANELLTFVLDKREEKTEEVIEDELISNLSLKDLFILGLTANHFNTLLIMIGLFLSFLNNIRDVITEQYAEFIDASTNEVMAGSMLVIIYGVVGVLLLTVLVSLVNTIITFANFKISRSVTGFTIKKGIINTSQQLIPSEKVQFVSWKTNWLRKRFSFYIFQFHTIGGTKSKKKLTTRAPATSDSSLSILAQNYSKLDQKEFVEPIVIHPSYYFRNTLFFGIIPIMLLAFPIYFFDPTKTLYLFIIPIYAALYFWLFQRKFRLDYTEEVIHIKTGVFGSRMLILKWDKIQSVKISQSLFQQKKMLADVIIYTAGGTISATYIPIETAREIQNFALFKIESKITSWE